MSYMRGPGVQHWHSIDTKNAGPYPPQDAGSASAVWPSANLAIYVPVIVRNRVVVRSLWFYAGTTGTGNYDIGLYDVAGAAILRSGSTAKGTTATEIVWDCTDTTIGPGVYYMALASNSGTDTYFRMYTAAPGWAAFGVLEQATAFPLPATATFAVPTTLTAAPMMGMLLNTIVT